MKADKVRLQEALLRLGAVTAEVVSAVEARSRARCPYKTVDSLCTFRGGCSSQQRELEVVRCGGDAFLAGKIE